MGGRVDDPLAGFDLAPTILDLIGLGPDAMPDANGRSFASLLRGIPQEGGSRLLFWEDHDDARDETGFLSERFSFAVRHSRFKLVYHGWDGVLDFSKAELFDMDDRPLNSLESKNVREGNEDVVRRLAREYEQWRLRSSRVDYDVSATSGDVKKLTGGGWIFDLDGDGTGGVVRIEDQLLLNPDDGALSVSMRVRAFEGPGTDGSVLAAKGESWGVLWMADKRMLVYLNDKNERYAWWSADPVYFGAKEQRVVLTLNHVGEQCERQEDPGAMRLFVDGQLVAFGRYDNPVRMYQRPTVQIGNNMAGTAPFCGTIRDLDFFNVNLLREESVP